MVVVRESPRAHLSPEKSPTQWPPRSPFQALLSSPSGRKKWQDHQSREGATSPSPTSARSRSLQPLLDIPELEDEEEDEETLQLKLEEIKAKLRLKKLQSAKKSSNEGHDIRESKQSLQRSVSPGRSERRPVSPTRLYQAAVEVPLSPCRNNRVPQEQLSPARQRLGLTSVPRAQDVSLRRARDGNQLRRQRSQPTLQNATSWPKPKSFSERIAESKQEAEEIQAKKEHLDRIRSSGFGHVRPESSASRRAQPVPSPAGPAVRVSIDDINRPSSAGRVFEGASNKNGARIRRCASAQVLPSHVPGPRVDGGINPGAYGQDSGTGHAESDTESSSIQIEAAPDDSGYDPFSKIHLSKRHISHSVIAREMEGKELYSLPRLLKKVKSPDYEPPDCESDYVVFAILASKSTPLDHAPTHRTTEKTKDDFEAPKNKFMVLHLCDFKWEIDCFLFGTAFNQFWKLTPGTLLAILNPAILPPKVNQHSGRFSLKLSSSEDAVMEIGVSRDLGYCRAVKKNGQQCGQWIDKRKTEACDFHLNLQIEKSRKERMEVNTMFRGAADPKDRVKNRNHGPNPGNNGGGGKYHREYGQLYSINSGVGKSAASLLDAEDTDALHKMTREEASRKRMASAQKERDLARRLGAIGTGMGAEYLRSSKHSLSTTTPTSTGMTSMSTAAEDARNALFAKPSVAELGLLGKRASDARLSPAKDRKKHFGLGARSMSSKTAMSTPLGWGGARNANLLQPKETSRIGIPERGQTVLDHVVTSEKQLQQHRSASASLVRPCSDSSSMRSNGSPSPVKKKARFVLDKKGIREPGRDSLPGLGNQSASAVATAAAAAVDDDDDDDIVVVDGKDKPAWNYDDDDDDCLDII